ncbi:MAG TPA: DMT family transporter, partial [Candidatus Acidoferrum sp.]|nr:DMT family transporter [Candidatus Acidoferrum sp.]
QTGSLCGLFLNVQLDGRAIAVRPSYFSAFMNWIAASLLSALFLGVYELCTKHAVRDNAVVPVLFFSTLSGAAVWIILLLAQAIHPGALPASLVTDPLTSVQHFQIVLKSAIVAASWIFTYFAIKHLPLSLGSPIRATSPLFTLFGALLVLGERPTWLETVGVLTTLVSFVGLSVVGSREGVHFHRDKWVWYLIAGTLLGAVSTLYDKYLLGRAHFSVPTVQAWFSVYLLVLFVPFAIGWKKRWWERNEFHWRWSIPVIAFSLLVADYIYFSALRDPASLVSIVMSLRRGSTLVGFAGGLLLFGEKHGWQKLPAVIGILVGIVLTVMG